MRSAVKSAIFLLLLAAGTDAVPLEQRGEIWLDLPALNQRIEANSSKQVGEAEVEAFDIRIGKSSNQVNYGSIAAKINTLSANIIMTTVSTPEGIICRFDLQRQGGFMLHPGRNSIEIAFNDRWERKNYASFVLISGEDLRGTDSAAQGEPERLGNAEKYAVVVGISQYKFSSPELPALKFADKDAASFRDFLLSPAGGSFKNENVKFLVNENATVQNIRSALFTFLTKPREHDLVMIYFAGHGSPDPNDRRNLYLLSYDTKLDDMGGTALPMWQLQDVFARVLKARRVVTFTDSCHSYGISGQQLGANAKSNNLVNQYLASYAASGERAVITGSDISELSAESADWGGGHGVFTWYLLKGLKGDADSNRDSTVTAGELFAYVRHEVSLATDKAQTPIAMPGLAERLALSGAGLHKPVQTARAGHSAPLVAALSH